MYSIYNTRTPEEQLRCLRYICGLASHLNTFYDLGEKSGGVIAGEGVILAEPSVIVQTEDTSDSRCGE